jgi:membrane-bound ClpP family serine protease
VIGSLLLINARAPFLQVSVVAIGSSPRCWRSSSWSSTAVIRARRRQVVTGREGLLGAPGVCAATSSQVVRACAHQATAASGGQRGRITVGEQIVVEHVDGLVLTVRRASSVIPAPTRPSSPAVAKSETARA